ncbi:MAG: hypothetical protein ACHQCI_04495 [Solirubrobacterales bacterium]
MMRKGYKGAAPYVWALVVLTMALGLTGCGESAPVTAAIDLKSSGMEANGELKPNVLCGWGSLWIPLEWGEVPDDTEELAILLARFKYVKEGGKPKPTVLFADLVSKFDPTERKLVANVLPEGVSWSWFGENCVTSAQGQQVLLEVFALDKVRHRKMDRRLATRLTEEALADPKATEGPRSPGELTEDAAAVGRLITKNYTGPH